MSYARKGVDVHRIQFLGKWKSSAVLQYIEEAMTEIPMNPTARIPIRRRSKECQRKEEVPETQERCSPCQERHSSGRT